MYVFRTINLFSLYLKKYLQVTDMDLEIIAATGNSPSSDSGLGMTVSDLKIRYLQVSKDKFYKYFSFVYHTETFILTRTYSHAHTFFKN